MNAEPVTAIGVAPTVASIESTRAAWLEERRTGLGGSDIAAVLGINGSAFAVWASKTQERPDEDADRPIANYLFWGKALERGIAEGYALITGEPIRFMGEQVLRHPAHSWWIGSPDGRLARRPIGIEVKNRGFSQVQNEGWGDSGSDEVPAYVAVQTFHYMPLLGADTEAFHVIALFGGNDHRIYVIGRDAEVEALIAEKGEEFWRRYVATNTPPPIDASASARAYLRHRFKRNLLDLREPTSDELDLLIRYQDVRRRHDELTEQKETFENEIKLAIGDHDGLSIGAKKAVTWKLTKDAIGPDYEAISRDLARQVVCADRSMDSDEEIDARATQLVAARAAQTTKVTRRGSRTFHFPPSGI